MKKAFSTKLIALFVLVLTVATLAVVSGAANVWNTADGTGYITTGEIAGATIDVKSTADNGDGTFTVVFDVNVADGYMIDDYDLHDGYIPLEPVVIVKEHQADGSFNRVVIEKLEKGDNAGYYVVKNWSTDCDIEVECVSPVEVIITGANYDDLTFEQDGHIYTLNGVGNHAEIVILNSKTDYTKAKLDGLTVDDYGHIIDAVNDTKGNSYFASVRITGQFSNFGTLTFTYGQGYDGATRSGEINKDHMVSSEIFWAGRYLIFANGTGADFVNRGVINVEARSVYMNVKNLINNGEINVTHSSQTSNQAARLYVYAEALTNNNVINQLGGNLYVGGSYGSSYDAVLGFVNCDTIPTVLVNNATINLQGTLSTYALDNKADAVIDGTVITYANPISGKDVSVRPAIALTGAVESKNAGTISLVSDANVSLKGASSDLTNSGSIVMSTETKSLAVEIKNLVNSGSINIEGGKDASFKLYGLLTNKEGADFYYFTDMGDFEIKYHGLYTETGVDVKAWEKGEYQNVLAWSAATGGYIQRGWPVGAWAAPLDTSMIVGLGIDNAGKMTIKGLSGGAGDGSFKNDGGYIINRATGDFTLCMQLRINTTQFVRGEIQKDGGWSDRYFVTKNYDIHNYGTLNLGGTVGALSYVTYLNNYEDAVINLAGPLYIAPYSGDAHGTYYRYASDGKGGFDLYTADYELNNYGTINVSSKASIFNYGDLVNGGVINNDGIINNFDWIYVQESGAVNNNGILNNGDADHVCDGSLVDCAEVGLLEIAGTFTNNFKVFNDWNSDIRVEGALDNVNGLLTNCGMIVNVGTFTTTVEGLDKKFAVNG